MSFLQIFGALTIALVLIIIAVYTVVAAIFATMYCLAKLFPEWIQITKDNRKGGD